MPAIPSSDLAGHKQLASRIDYALDTCQETQSIEFTASQPWETHQWGITKTALAMGNLRDGGILVIGVSQRNDEWELSGMPDEHLATYDVDKIVAHVNAYVSPHASLSIVVHKREDKNLLVIAIREFEDTPLVCKKNRESEKLTEGRVYVRPPGKPENKPITNAQEMHELLELAAEKRARRLIERARRVGLVPSPSAADAFDEQLEGL